MIRRFPNFWIVITLLVFVVMRPLFPFPLCPFRTLFGISCPTCGVTTALRYCLSGDLVHAMSVNLAVVPVVAILLRTCVLDLTVHSTARDVLESRYCELGLLAVFLVTGFVQSSILYAR